MCGQNLKMPSNFFIGTMSAKPSGSWDNSQSHCDTNIKFEGVRFVGPKDDGSYAIWCERPQNPGRRNSRSHRRRSTCKSEGRNDVWHRLEDLPKRLRWQSRKISNVFCVSGCMGNYS